MAVALCLLLIHLSTAHAATLLRGQMRTCHDFADLDSALDHPNSLYFKGWTGADFDAAQSWAASCLTATPSGQEQERESLLAERRRRLEASGEIQRNESALQRHREEELRDDEEREREQRAADAKQQSARAAYDACLRSPAYQRFVAEGHVVGALARQSAAQEELRREQRVEELSETVNLTAKRNAGAAVVAAQDELAKWWVLYVRSGGKAGNPQAVSEPSNPCE